MKLNFIRTLTEETKSIRELSVLGIAFRRLWERGSKTGVVLALIFSAVEASLYTLNPIVLRHLIDTLNRGYNFGWEQAAPVSIPYSGSLSCHDAALWMTGIMVGLSVLWYAAYNLSTGFARNATYKSQVTFGSDAFAHIVSLDMDFHVESRKGEILNKTDQAIIAAQDFLYNSFFNNFLRAALSIVLVLGVLFRMDWRLFAICTLTLSLGVYTNLVFGSQVSKEEKKAWQNVSKVLARALDVMHNIRETKTFGNEQFEIERRKEEAEKQLLPLGKITLLWRKLTTIQNLWQNFGFAVAMMFLILPAVFAHKLTVGQVAQFISYYLMLFAYFMDMLFKYLNAQRLVPKLKELRDLLATTPSVQNRPGAVSFPGLRNGLCLDHVTFRYPKALGGATSKGNVLDDVSIVFPKGDMTVLAGKTGCGKTTVSNLLMRLHEPSAGTVLCDGVDIRNFTKESYRRAFTVLSQQAYLFSDSIGFNISYSRLGSSEEQIVGAAKIARIHDYISGLEKGYNTGISEGASNISGGQKQRIALARAVLASDAEIVVLDEPTTGLDTVTAREFMDELIRVFSGKTIIVITHDPKIMGRADQIVYIENGKVASTGRHQDLLETCAGYRELALAG